MALVGLKHEPPLPELKDSLLLMQRLYRLISLYVIQPLEKDRDVYCISVGYLSIGPESQKCSHIQLLQSEALFSVGVAG